MCRRTIHQNRLWLADELQVGPGAPGSSSAGEQPAIERRTNRAIGIPHCFRSPASAPFRNWGAVVVLALLLGSAASALAQTRTQAGAKDSAPATSTNAAKNIVQRVGLDQHLDAQVPLDLTFRDEQGHAVKLGSYFREKPVVLMLVYYRCPMLCTQVLNGFLESSQGVELTMGADYEVVSVSIDPRETTSMAREKKKRYAESYHRPGAQEGWHFLTGDSAAIEELAKTVGYRYVYDPKTDQYAHASGIMVLTPTGRISRYMYGIDYAPDDLRLALVEASEGRIGSLTDRFLLLCYHYDPATGKYGFAIENAIRAAGASTVFMMGGFLWLMFRRERQRTLATSRAELSSVSNLEQE